MVLGAGLPQLCWGWRWETPPQSRLLLGREGTWGQGREPRGQGDTQVESFPPGGALGCSAPTCLTKPTKELQLIKHYL